MSENLTRSALEQELWNMLPDNCKKSMLPLKETYIESLMADIDSYSTGRHPQPGAAWIKASERTPTHDGIVHLKIVGLNRVGNFFDNGLGKGVYVNGPEPYSFGEEKFSEIYWLDESGTAATGREEDAISFAEWILNNHLEQTFNDNGKQWIDYRLPSGQNKISTGQLYELFKQKEKPSGTIK